MARSISFPTPRVSAPFELFLELKLRKWLLLTRKWAPLHLLSRVFLLFDAGCDFESLLVSARSGSSTSDTNSDCSDALSFASHQASLALAIACYRDLLAEKVGALVL